MSKSSIIVFFAVVGIVSKVEVSWAGPAGDTGAAKPADATQSMPPPCVTSIVVEDPVQWISALPERQPPTTSRLSFDEGNGAHVEIEWDPYDGRGLSREVALTRGTWQVSFWSEPQRNSLNFAENYAWQTRAAQTCASWPVSPGATADHVVVERRGKDASEEPRVHLRGMKKKALGPLGALGRGDHGVAALSAGELSRAFPIVDAPDKLAQMLVRAVTSTVKRKAVRLASQRLRVILCAERTRGGKSERILRSTCSVFEDLDLRSLSATARPAVTALVLDFLRLAAEKLAVKRALVDRILATSGAAIAVLRSRPDVTAAEIQGLFLSTAGAFLDGDDDPGMCAARLALSLVSYCHASNQCGAGFVRDVVSHPQDYFEGTETCGVDWKPAAAAIDRIEAVIADGRLVLDSAKNLTSADRLRALTRSSLRLLEITVCDGKHRRYCQVAKQMCAIGAAAVEGDLQATIRVGLRAVGPVIPWTERQRKFATLFFNFVGEAAAVVPGSPEETRAAQVRVERALETVLDDAANRDGRDGDWIIGLGTGLRVIAGWEVGQGFRGPVSVPIALTLDRLTRRGDRTPGKAKGLHLELGFLDAGNYLRVDNDAETEDVNWADVAALSLGLGYFWGDDAMPLYVGISSGIAPGIDEDGSGRTLVWHLGAQAGLYFPVLDFN